jgi:hypothetical protein
MGTRSVRARLAEYEKNVRAFLEGLERDAAVGRPLSAPMRVRLQAFVERLNRDLVELYERDRADDLDGAERDVLLPAVEQLRDLLRGIGTAREPAAAVRRLRSAAAAVARG